MPNFEKFHLPPALMQSLSTMKITIPTPIQTAAIPPALEGQDILASAQTGTGKTLAYALPIATGLINKPSSTALILAPTRELAIQVKDALRQLMGKTPALLIGGESMPKQLAQLRAQPRVIIGTPGRINDHLVRGSLNLSRAQFLVIDEADRMLDMGFGVQIDKIIKNLPAARQTLMFSATLPANIVKLSEKYLRQPQRVSVDSTTLPAPKIKQEIIRTTSADKFTHLLKELEARQGSIIVFVKTKRGADNLSDKLRRQNQNSSAIHGNLSQNRRERVIQDFRNYKSRILVATDIAARGLDIPHIEHVINYDLPQCPEDYIHRIGRTARAGAEGSALCLISPDDGAKWHAIRKLMHPEEANTNEGRRFSDRPQQPRRPFRGKDGAGKPRRFGDKDASGGKPGGHDGAAKPRRFGDRDASSGKPGGHDGAAKPRRFGDRDASGGKPGGHDSAAKPRRFANKDTSGGKPGGHFASKDGAGKPGHFKRSGKPFRKKAG